MVVADVKCYLCGHISGELIGTRAVPVKEWTFEPRKGEPRVAGAKLRCIRCNGSVYLEDLRPFVADDPVRMVRRRLAGLGSAA
ncbi:MAG: hypothetical protein HYX51_08275 [Chloroflexi bacterium]|nr:hypothetical protein [Chloroflexota bacterium]